MAKQILFKKKKKEEEKKRDEGLPLKNERLFFFLSLFRGFARTFAEAAILILLFLKEKKTKKKKKKKKKNICLNKTDARYNMIN